jgi:hypothetical protein
MNCWEFKKCGREKGGANAKKLGVCPAYPSNGKRCASVAGTLSGKGAQGTFAAKMVTCLKCGYYMGPHYDRSMVKPR